MHLQTLFQTLNFQCKHDNNIYLSIYVTRSLQTQLEIDNKKMPVIEARVYGNGINDAI